MSDDLYDLMDEETKNRHLLRQFQKMELRDKVDNLGLLLCLIQKLNIKSYKVLDLIAIFLFIDTILLGIIVYKMW